MAVYQEADAEVGVTVKHMARVAAVCQEAEARSTMPRKRARDAVLMSARVAGWAARVRCTAACTGHHGSSQHGEAATADTAPARVACRGGDDTGLPAGDLYCHACT
eukprot:355280-Chlamydomonas_euryale.AAC.2